METVRDGIITFAFYIISFLHECALHHGHPHLVI